MFVCCLSDAFSQREDLEAVAIPEECIFMYPHLITSKAGIGHIGTRPDITGFVLLCRLTIIFIDTGTPVDLSTMAIYSLVNSPL